MATLTTVVVSWLLTWLLVGRLHIAIEVGPLVAVEGGHERPRQHPRPGPAATAAAADVKARPAHGRLLTQ